MNVVRKLRELFAKVLPSRNPEMRSIVLMQRKPHRFSAEELRSAAERGWGKKFDGRADPMYFVSATNPVLVVVKAGPHVLRVTSIPRRYADDDEYALGHLPQPEQKKAWTEHRACTFLELFNDLNSRKIPDAEAYAALARLALQLGDPNCAAIFLPLKNMMMTNDGTAEEGLRLLINKELQLGRR